MKDLYASKSPDYFASARREILPLLPDRCGRVLDVGCGQGATIGWLKSLGRVQESWGIELMEAAAARAADSVDHVIVGDVETDDIAFQQNQFNLILCLDVLEHLKDPWTVLRRLVGYLEQGGMLIASLPNIRHYSVVRDLALHGRFDYQDAGLLDRTHLRFFTARSAVALLEVAGLRQVELMLHPGKVEGLRGLANRVTGGLFRDMFSWQLLLRGRRAETGARA